MKTYEVTVRVEAKNTVAAIQAANELMADPTRMWQAAADGVVSVRTARRREAEDD